MKNINFVTVCIAMFSLGCVFMLLLMGAVVLGVGGLIIDHFYYVDSPRGTVVFDPAGNWTAGGLVRHKSEYTVVSYDRFQLDPEELNVFVGDRRIATVSFQRSDFSEKEADHLLSVAREGRERFLQERERLIQAHYQPDQLARNIANVLVTPGHIDMDVGGSGNIYWWYQSQLDSVIDASGLRPFIVKLDYDGIWDLNATESQKCPNQS